MSRLDWQRVQAVQAQRVLPYSCGHCGREVASSVAPNIIIGHIRICPLCSAPTYFTGDRQLPGSIPGRTVNGVPDEVAKLYDEARRSAAAGSFTASVLTCRKILMHVAVEKQVATPGQSFVTYVENLLAAHYLPKGSERWVAYIRGRGNEANHAIVLMSKDDAEALIKLVEMLLALVYELPASVPAPASAPVTGAHTKPQPGVPTGGGAA